MMKFHLHTFSDRTVYVEQRLFFSEHPFYGPVNASQMMKQTNIKVMRTAHILSM